VSAYPYRSGWCGVGRHEGCAGVYAGTDCTCTCHQPVAESAAVQGIPADTPDPVEPDRLHRPATLF
jgi:hypothetical protein